MRMMIIYGFAAAALGAALAIGLGTQAQAAAPANYSRACTEIVASNGFVEKAGLGTARRPARHTARRNPAATPRTSAERLQRSSGVVHCAQLSHPAHTLGGSASRLAATMNLDGCDDSVCRADIGPSLTPGSVAMFAHCGKSAPDSKERGYSGSNL
jgi:hypothetical protein